MDHVTRVALFWMIAVVVTTVVCVLFQTGVF